MRAKQTIIYAGKNLADVFGLDCVKAVIKTEEGDPALILYQKKLYLCDHMTSVVLPGDIMEELADGTWKIIRTTTNKVKL